jgi:hypothetical protein
MPPFMTDYDQEVHSLIGLSKVRVGRTASLYSIPWMLLGGTIGYLRPTKQVTTPFRTNCGHNIKTGHQQYVQVQDK